MSGALRIASARGIPGTAGALVTNAAGEHFLLSSHHVVFGGGACVNDSVWALPEERDESAEYSVVRLGRAHPGHVGRTPHRDRAYFVDCALVALELDTDCPAWLRTALYSMPPHVSATATPGIRVSKCGAATGRTEGIVVDCAYADHPCIQGQWWSAPGQLLIDSADSDLNFSAPGDSGAAVLDEHGRIVGLLWGSNANGQGVACPIGPVLACLGVSL